MVKGHSFHVPVMGIGFTIDTPLKVAKYGIDSVIFITDDIIIEKMRKMYCEKLKLPYTEIGPKDEDSRARRITSYLNMIKKLSEERLDKLISTSTGLTGELKKYFNMLPDASALKLEFKKISENISDFNEVKKWLKDNLSIGDINVNIMTKLDKNNYVKDEQLPIEFNDAHASLRGYAESDLESSMVFSAGMNPRLFAYIEKFDDFFPDEHGYIKKKVVLKVSDYRSAIIQGKFLAKKGVWVSEYRIESGLNCGGHAFASEGILMGPILEEFKNNKDELVETVNEILVNALESQGRVVPKNKLDIRFTAQGGVGTSEEHDFLVDKYEVDSVGWGTPFLLVPEVTNVNESTLQQLKDAKEEDLYISNSSPLGVAFNNLRGNTKDIQRIELIDKGRPGSPCPKKFLALSPEFTDKTICTASRKYQKLKIEELDGKRSEMTDEAYNAELTNITDKLCLCVGLGTAAMIKNNIDLKGEGSAVAICPGPNLAYYDKTSTLEEMVGHIYGTNDVLTRKDRPNMFVKELRLYLDYFKQQIDKTPADLNRKQQKYLTNYGKNMEEGIQYYKDMFSPMADKFTDSKDQILSDFKDGLKELRILTNQVEKLIAG